MAQESTHRLFTGSLRARGYGASRPVVASGRRFRSLRRRLGRSAPVPGAAWGGAPKYCVPSVTVLVPHTSHYLLPSPVRRARSVGGGGRGGWGRGSPRRRQPSSPPWPSSAPFASPVPRLSLLALIALAVVPGGRGPPWSRSRGVSCSVSSLPVPGFPAPSCWHSWQVASSRSSSCPSGGGWSCGSLIRACTAACRCPVFAISRFGFFVGLPRMHGRRRAARVAR